MHGPASEGEPISANQPAAESEPALESELDDETAPDGSGDDVTPDEVAAPALTDEETAAVIAFVEELLSIAARRTAPRLLAEHTDWTFVETVEAAMGRPVPDERFQRRWFHYLDRALSHECGRRPWTITAFAPGVVDGHFEAPAIDITTPTPQRRAREELSRALAESLVVSSPCEPLADQPGFDLLLRRESDGGLAVRGFRRREPPRQLRL